MSKFILIFAFFITPFWARGQNEAPGGQKFSVGLKAGPSISWLSFADDARASLFGTEEKVGFFVGGVIQFPLKHNFTMATEFGYARSGRRITFNDGTWENNATYNFLDFSMLLRKSYAFKLKKDVYTAWFFNIGPNVKYWISGKGEVKTRALGQPYVVVFEGIPAADFTHNYVNEVNRWLFGLDLGIGIEGRINRNQRIFTEFRFNYGHTYFGKKNSTSHIELLGFDDNLLANMKTLSVNLTYFFDFDTRASKMGKSTKDKEIKRKR